MHVRKSKVRDRSAILRIARKFASEIGLADKKAMLEEHVGTSKVIVACNEDDKAVGFTYAYMRGKGHSLYNSGREHLYISAVCVDPSYQSKGAGKAMLNELVTSNAHRRIRANVLIPNEIGVKLYNSLGFDVQGNKIHFVREAEKGEQLLSTASAHLRPFEVDSNYQSHPYQTKTAANSIQVLQNVINEFTASGRTEEANALSGIKEYIGTVVQSFGSKTVTESKQENTMKSVLAKRLERKVADQGNTGDEMFQEEMQTAFEESSPISKQKTLTLDDGNEATMLFYDNGDVQVWRKGVGDLARVGESIIRQKKLTIEDIINMANAKLKSASSMRLADKIAALKTTESSSDDKSATKVDTQASRLRAKISTLDTIAEVSEVVDETASAGSGNIPRIDGTSDSIHDHEQIPKNIHDIESLQSTVTEFAPLSSDQGSDGAKPEGTDFREDGDVLPVDSVVQEIPEEYPVPKNPLERKEDDLSTLDDLDIREPVIKEEDDGTVKTGPRKDLEPTNTLSDEADTMDTPIGDGYPTGEAREGGQVEAPPMPEQEVDTNMVDDKEVSENDGDKKAPSEGRIPDEEDLREKAKKMKDRIPPSGSRPMHQPSEGFRDGVSHHGSKMLTLAMVKEGAKYCEWCRQTFFRDEKCPKCGRPTRELTVEDVQKENAELARMLGREPEPVGASKKTAMDYEEQMPDDWTEDEFMAELRRMLEEDFDFSKSVADSMIDRNSAAIEHRWKSGKSPEEAATQFASAHGRASTKKGTSIMKETKKEYDFLENITTAAKAPAGSAAFNKSALVEASTMTVRVMDIDGNAWAGFEYPYNGYYIIKVGIATEEDEGIEDKLSQVESILAANGALNNHFPSQPHDFDVSNPYFTSEPKDDRIGGRFSGQIATAQHLPKENVDNTVSELNALADELGLKYEYSKIESRKTASTEKTAADEVTTCRACGHAYHSTEVESTEKFMIAAETPDPDDGQLYWSNKDGWVLRDSADVFSGEEKGTGNLPVDGKWVSATKKKAQYTAQDIADIIAESEVRDLFDDDATDEDKMAAAKDFLDDLNEEGIEDVDLVKAAVDKAASKLPKKAETQGDILRARMSHHHIGTAAFANAVDAPEDKADVVLNKVIEYLKTQKKEWVQAHDIASAIGVPVTDIYEARDARENDYFYDKLDTKMQQGFNPDFGVSALVEMYTLLDGKTASVVGFNNGYDFANKSFKKTSDIKEESAHVTGFFDYELGGGTFEIEYDGVLYFGNGRKPDDLNIGSSSMPTELFDDNYEAIEEKALDVAHEDYHVGKTGSKNIEKISNNRRSII